MKSYDYDHLVTFDETNLVGNAYFAHYLRWQGHCREHFLLERAPEVARRLGEDLALLTLDCSCEFIAELFAGDRVTVRMTLDDLADGEIAMRFAYYRAQPPLPRLVARGAQRVACVRRTGDGAERTPVPAELADALRPYAAE